MIVDEVGGRRDVEGCSRGVCHVEPFFAPGDVAVRPDHHAAVGLQSCRDAFLLHACHGGRKHAELTLSACGDAADDLRLHRTREVDAHRQGAFPAGRHVADDDVIGKRGKGHPLVPHIIIYVACGGVGVLQVQVALVSTDVAVPQGEPHAAQRQVAHAVGTLDEVLTDESVGLLFLALEDESAHLRQRSERLPAVVLMGSSAPECFLVQPYFLRIGAAIDHAAQVAVADGQCLEPPSRRPRVPQPQFLFAVCSASSQGKHQGYQQKPHVFHRCSLRLIRVIRG